ncbi:MAG: hypothetical protein PHO92_03345 [Candidatus Peribacteraceae bacterium]|nr:hypothetical protein [Candidatus Peribacteraceae bacterium]
MRIRVFIGVFLGTCMLVSCVPGRSVAPSVAPEEVLRRSAEASRTLRSAAFDGSADITVRPPDPGTVTGHLSFTGVLQDAGQQVRITAEGTAAGGTDERPVRGKGKVELMTAGDSDTFFFLHELEGDEEQSLFNPEAVGKVAGKWWRIPGQQRAGSVAITPDPGLLQAQVEVVKVTREYGIRTLDGAQVFHYDVTMDPDLLVTFLRKVAEEKGEEFDETEVRKSVGRMRMEGELWIDADTYYVRKLEWQIEQDPADDRGAQVTILFRMSMRDHNKADPIILPESAEPFSPFVLLGGDVDAGTSPALEELLPEEESAGAGAFDGFDAMTPEQQQQFLQQFLGGGAMPSLP